MSLVQRLNKAGIFACLNSQPVDDGNGLLLTVTLMRDDPRNQQPALIIRDEYLAHCRAMDAEIREEFDLVALHVAQQNGYIRFQVNDSNSDIAMWNVGWPGWVGWGV